MIILLEILPIAINNTFITRYIVIDLLARPNFKATKGTFSLQQQRFKGSGCTSTFVFTYVYYSSFYFCLHVVNVSDMQDYITTTNFTEHSSFMKNYEPLLNYKLQFKGLVHFS